MSLRPDLVMVPVPAPPADAPAGGLLELRFERGGDWWRVGPYRDGLRYERGRGGRALEQVEAEPQASEWRRFWSTVERLGAWRWADAYEGEGADRWELTLRHGDRRLVTVGRGAFPPLADGRPSPEFLTFSAAVSQLVGVLPPFP